MAVKLLQKNELANLKAKEQAREVGEGIKIATRVDALRQTYSKTEQELEMYRNATLAEIQRQINALNEEKEDVMGKVKALQSKYDSMMPEISMKRTELSQFEKSLKGWEKKLEKREEKSLLEELDVAEAKKKAKLSLAVNQDNERITANLLIEAAEKSSIAHATMQRAKNVEEKAYSDKKDIEASLILREYSIKTKEDELLKKEMNLEAKEKELNIEIIRVKDQRETLERSLQRIKAGRLA